MNSLKSLPRFECVNHQINESHILSTIFDIYNPCSFCKNRKVANVQNLGYYNQLEGRLEFPFVVELNCQNFAREITHNDIMFYEYAKDIQKEITFISLKPSDFRKDFDENFYETETRNLRNITINGSPFQHDSINYPNAMSAGQFHSEMNANKLSLQELIELAKANEYRILKEFNIRASNIEHFALRTSNDIMLLEQQINVLNDYLYKNRNQDIPFTQLMKFLINTAAGGSVWDYMKFSIDKIITFILATK